MIFIIYSLRSMQAGLKNLGSLSFHLFGLATALLAVCFLIGCAPKVETVSTSARVVSVGGSTTETIYALGAQDQLVGTDTSSVYPAEAAKLPQVGYQRTLSAEGVLSLKPTLVIVSADAGPPAAIEQIENAGVKVVRVDGQNTEESTVNKIRRIAELMGKKEKGEDLIKQLESDIRAAKPLADAAGSPKVAFIFSRGPGSVQVSGTNTPADAMIRLAGGRNAVTEFELYKPLTPEAMIAAQPDVILLPARGLESMGGVDAILKLPGVAETPAGKSKKVVAIDDVLLLGFTPRLGLAVKELAEKIK